MNGATGGAKNAATNSAEGNYREANLAPDEALSQWLSLAQQAERTGHFVMISHEAHFLDVLVSTDRERLRSSPDVVRPSLLDLVAGELLPRFEQGLLARGIYFPVPLQRALRSGRPFEDAIHRFFYDLIQVDEQQRWWWRQAPVADRTRDYLIDHLRWEGEIGRWIFEYRVHDGWWDKSYLEAASTPLRGVQLSETSDGGAELTLQSGRRVAADLATLRFDEHERLYCVGKGVGEVLLADAVRLRLITTMDESMQSVTIAGERRAVRWPTAGTEQPPR